MSRVLLPLLAIVSLFIIVFEFAVPVGAMPEYAARTGEPCASCHVSPAGGGLRNLRGQAWVLMDKPGTLPSTNDALKALGIQLPSDLSIYTAAPSTVPVPAPLNTSFKTAPLVQQLVGYEGN
jgi:hypothetical protein